MDTLEIQRSLTSLEDRYRELREIGEKHRQAWEAAETNLRANLAEVRGEKEGLEKELADARQDSELLLLQLHQVQEELEHYFLENQRKEEKLHWLRGQRVLLLRMLRLQGHVQQRFLALDGRIAMPSLRRQLMPWWQRLQRS